MRRSLRVLTARRLRPILHLICHGKAGRMLLDSEKWHRHCGLNQGDFVINHLVWRKEPLPANAKRPTIVDRRAFAEEVGVCYDTVGRDDRPAARALLAAALRLGLRLKLLPRENDLHRVADLMRLGRARAQADSDVAAMLDLDAFQAATRRLLKTSGKPWPTSSARVLIERLLQDDDFDSIRSAVLRFQGYLAAAETGAGCPDDFANAFEFECALRQIAPSTFNFINEELGPQLFKRWGEGKSKPTANREPLVLQIEFHLGLPAGYLWKKVTHELRFDVSTADITASVDLTRHERDKIREEIRETDYIFQDDAGKKFIIKEATSKVLARYKLEQGKISAQRMDSYRLKYENWPAALRDDWNKWKAFRSRRLSQLNMVLRRGGLNSESMRMKRFRFELFFGFLVNRMKDLVSVNGMNDEYCVNIPASELRLQMFNAYYLGFYHVWMSERKANFNRERNMTRADLQLWDEMALMWYGK